MSDLTNAHGLRAPLFWWLPNRRLQLIALLSSRSTGLQDISMWLSPRPLKFNIKWEELITYPHRLCYLFCCWSQKLAYCLESFPMFPASYWLHLSKSSPISPHVSIATRGSGVTSTCQENFSSLPTDLLPLASHFPIPFLHGSQWFSNMNTWPLYPLA